MSAHSKLPRGTDVQDPLPVVKAWFKVKGCGVELEIMLVRQPPVSDKPRSPMGDLVPLLMVKREYATLNRL